MQGETNDNSNGSVTGTKVTLLDGTLINLQCQALFKDRFYANKKAIAIQLTQDSDR